MSDERSYQHRVTNRTAAANATGKRQRVTYAPKHYVHNPGPRAQLAAAAGPSRAGRLPNASISWEPALRGASAQHIWESAEHVARQRGRTPASQEAVSERRERSATNTAETGALNFAGMLDDLRGDTRVDMLGVPVTDYHHDFESDGERRTSEGKTQVDYLHQFKEQNLAPQYAQLIIAFRHAPPLDLKCSACQRTGVARWRCGHCILKRDFCSSCLRQTHWSNPFHTIGWWTGQHYRKAWLRDAGVAILLCPNAQLGEGCPNNPGCRPNFDTIDTEPPPSYGSFTVAAPSAASSDASGDDSLTAAVRPDDDVHLPPAFRDVDEGEIEDLYLPPGPGLEDDFQPIGPPDEEGAESHYEYTAGVARDGGKTSIPTKDLYGHRTLVVVHTDAIHGIGVGFCRCPEAPSEDRQLVKYAGLFPASQDIPSTAFTLQFLEYRHFDDVICKTSAQAHMRKIRRCTEPDELRLAPNRYPKLLLVSRLYTAIKNLIDFGYASQPLANWREPPAGGLVWKCIVCPRKTPEFNNLPKIWERDPDEWRKFVSLCYDGNFSGDHTISRRPGNNVSLYPGTGMFDLADAVAAHAARALDDRALRRIYPDLNANDKPCHEHKAAATVGKVRSKVVDIKGIGSWACSRHGCFCACATNNFTLGESSSPVDKSLDSAFCHTITDQITRVQLLYDIWCRYGVHVQKRFKHSGLDWPKFREVLQGVGVWHIYGHVFECFRRFSPDYSPRAGIVDGEILETLWSLLNGILQACRGMSLAAREEKINMHMNDINHRKIIEMTGTLVRKYRKYSRELKIRRHHLSQLELSCGDDDIERWETARRALEEKRVKDPYYADAFWESPTPPSDPGKQVVEVRLLEDDDSGLVKAIMQSLKLEENSLRMQAQGKEWGASLEDRRTAAIARTRFNNRRIKANRELATLLDQDFQDDELLPPRLAKILDEDEWAEDDEVLHRHQLRVQPEFRPVSLPSAWPVGRRKKEHLTEMEQEAMGIEMELRLADMAERLQAIREGLCDQAQGYRLTIRNKKGKGSANYRERTNAWLHVRQQTKDVRVHAAIYNHHVRRLHLIFWDDAPRAQARYAALKGRYKLILASDIRCSTATYEMYNNMRTRGEFKLPWFWRMQDVSTAVDEEAQEDMAGDEQPTEDDESFIAQCERRGE
ncbi:unnamed protein product [Peniophora sp. CBMAI 1063]|nr:unnamed protein product [Peniophora sp. CBMAI 1063]